MMGAQGVACVDLMGAEEVELKKKGKIILIVVINLGFFLVCLLFYFFIIRKYILTQ